MSQPKPFLALVFFLLLFIAQSLVAQQSSDLSFDELIPPTKSELESALTDLASKTSGNVDAIEKQKQLITLSLEDLKRAEAFEKKRNELANLQATADTKLKQLNEQLEQEKNKPSAKENAFSNLTVEAAQSELSRYEAELLSLNHDIKTHQTSLNERAKNVANIREKLNTTRSKLEQTQADLRRLSSETNTVEFKQIRLWHLLTQRSSLQAEAEMLEVETKIQPTRYQLINADLSFKKTRLKNLNTTVDLLKNSLLKKRINKVSNTLSSAEQAAQRIQDLSENVKQYAASNESMGAELARLATQIQAGYQRRDQIKAQTTVLNREFSAVQMKIELMGLSQELGELLANQRDLLPDLRLFQNERQAVYDELTSITLRRLEVQNELGWRFDPEFEKDELLKSLNKDPGKKDKQDIKALVDQRSEILKQLDETSDTYLTLLTEIDHNLSALIKTVTEYQSYLKRSLIWIRIPYNFGKAELTLLEKESQNLTKLSNLINDSTYTLGQSLKLAIWHSLIILLSLAARSITHKKRREALKTLQFGTVNFFRVGEFLLLTSLKVAPAALLAFFAMFHLKEALFPTTIEVHIAKLWLYILLCGFMYYLAKPNGFLESFLQWPKEIVNQTYYCSRILYLFVSPILFLAYIPVNALENQGSGIVGSLLQITCMGSFLYCTYRFLKQPYRILESIRRRTLVADPTTTQKLFAVAITCNNIFWILCFIAGYRFASGKVCSATFETMILLMYGIILHQILTLWIRKVQLNQKYRIQKEEKGLKEKDKSEASDRDTKFANDRLDELKENIQELGENSRKLIALSVWSIGLLIFYTIWSPLLPALAIFNEVTLWTYEVAKDGDTLYQAVSLRDFLYVIVVTTLLFVASKRLPQFIEMLIRNKMPLDNGTLYTSKTLLSYLFIAAAVIYAGKSFGFSWSKIQWAIAALSVGIGFGLQEIVANFISGIIILFERPIRVGDLVTIGQHTGTVRRIQIRATTIVDFDNKELLVPNKEFITTALLNWTLSDREVRIVVSVGISYSSNVELALQILEQIAKDNPKVLKEPQPVVTFESFGDSTLNLCLRCRVGSIDDRLQTITDIHKAIKSRYHENNIEIAFPQRDLHIINSKPLEFVMAEKVQSNDATATSLPSK